MVTLLKRIGHDYGPAIERSSGHDLDWTKSTWRTCCARLRSPPTGGHTSNAWALLFQMAARYHGIRRRRFNLVPKCAGTSDEWRDTMEATAREDLFFFVFGPPSGIRSTFQCGS
eukprot:9497301-Pyramimonas_sp.AAC.1